MRRLPLLLSLLLLAPTPAAAAGKVLLVARDLEKKPILGLCFSYAGVTSAKTNETGATEMAVPARLRVGQSIELSLLPCSPRTEDWFLVGSLINVPDPAEPAYVVLMRRRVFRKIANEVSSPKAVTAGRSEKQAAENPKKALVAAAAKYGLTEAQVETALGSFAETKDTNDRGIALYLQGRYSQAEQVLEGPVEKEERDLAEKLRYLGAAQFGQGKYPVAAESFRKAVALRGEDTDLLNWLGRCFYELAEWAEAEPLIRRALAIDEKNLRPEDPIIAIHLNNLAMVLKDTNRLGEAEPLMRRALAIEEKSFGPEHPNVARDLNNLAQVLQDADRRVEAEPLMRRALAIDEKSFGTEHATVALGLSNLAQLLQDTNRPGEAELLMRRALAIDEKSCGPEHPNVARDLNNLASLFEATNRLVEAEPLMRRALAIHEKSFGPEHPTVAVDLNNLATLLQETSRLDDAEPLMRRVL